MLFFVQVPDTIRLPSSKGSQRNFLHFIMLKVVWIRKFYRQESLSILYPEPSSGKYGMLMDLISYITTVCPAEV
jgi:hypothetical protein